MQNDASKNKRRLLLVMAVFAVPLIASYLAYFVWQPQGAVGNYGELIQPEPLPETLRFAKLEGGQITLKELRGKWLMVQVDAGGCAAACEQKLYAMRQVRLMQGKEQDRVLRLWLVTDDAVPSPVLKQKIDSMLLLKDASGALIAQLTAQTPGQANVKQHIYLIDPLGNLMLRWPGNPDMKRMHKDLERLLKYSQIG
ncbi:MAG: hypothetical protein AABY73_08325 [Pseudomonadota bacterium]